MAEMIKVKFPRSQTGWALLALSDFYTPRQDGSCWEKWTPEKMSDTPTNAESLKAQDSNGILKATRKLRQTRGE